MAKLSFSLWYWLVKRRVAILIISVLAVGIYSGLHFLYPSTTLTVAVGRTNVDADGKLTGYYNRIKNHLADCGVRLEYRFEADDAKARSFLEWAIENPDY